MSKVAVFGLAWKLFFLPISIIGGSLGLVTEPIRLSFRVSGYVLSYWLTIIGLTNSGRNRKPASTPPAVLASERIDFLSEFGEINPNSVPGGFTDTVDGFSLIRQFDGSSSSEEETIIELRSVVEENAPALVVDIENEDTNNQPLMEEQDTPHPAAVEADQFEGPSSPEEIVTQVQTVLEENAPVLALDTTNEHTHNPPLMEKQDTQNGAALEADQANECDTKEDENGIERESNLSEEEDLQFVFEPEQEPDVIQVLVRLPIGERIGKSFPRTTTLQSVYELVDSSGCLDVGSYTLVNFFPRVLYGQDQRSSTLEQLGLHPQTCLFVELNS